jgi:hypothetical protein
MSLDARRAIVHEALALLVAATVSLGCGSASTRADGGRAGASEARVPSVDVEAIPEPHRGDGDAAADAAVAEVGDPPQAGDDAAAAEADAASEAAALTDAGVEEVPAPAAVDASDAAVADAPVEAVPVGPSPCVLGVAAVGGCIL